MGSVQSSSSKLAFLTVSRRPAALLVLSNLKEFMSLKSPTPAHYALKERKRNGKRKKGKKEDAVKRQWREKKMKTPFSNS